MIRADAELNAGGFIAGLVGMNSKMLSVIGSARGMASAFAGIAVVGGVIAALKSTIDMGGELNDLSNRVGESVADLMVLQQAFKNAGLPADGIVKFKAALAGMDEDSAAASQGLEKLGLNNDKFRSSPLLDQVKQLQAGLAKLGSEAEKTEALRDIFGGKGLKYGSLLNDPEALKGARDQLGGMPELMQKMAPIFDTIGDALGVMGLKVQQFAAGFLEGIGPQLQDFLVELSKIDLTGLGEWFGKLAAWGGTLLRALTPVLQVLRGITDLMGERHDVPGAPSARKPGTDEELAGGPAARLAVTGLAAVGGNFGGLQYDMASRQDRTNTLLEDIRSDLRTRLALPDSGSGRPDVPV